VTGLRRAEVAMLAGASVEYYTRLERGNVARVSKAVLDAIAGALRLHDAERDHLFALARAALARAGEAAAPRHPRHDGAAGCAVHPRRDHRRACAGP
jgi:transcriptional regulator with XRE-family HTH domain